MEHTVRTEDNGQVTLDNYTRSKAIKAMCTECMNFHGNAKTDCTSPLCPLYPYRGRVLHMTEEQRQAASERGKASAPNWQQGPMGGQTDAREAPKTAVDGIA